MLTGKEEKKKEYFQAKSSPGPSSLSELSHLSVSIQQCSFSFGLGTKLSGSHCVTVGPCLSEEADTVDSALGAVQLATMLTIGLLLVRPARVSPCPG